MGGITDTDDNRNKLKHMTLDKWKRTALDSQYRWILLSKKMIADGNPDYLDKIGVDEEERARIIGTHNQRRQDATAKKKLSVTKAAQNLNKENRSLIDRIEEQDQKINDSQDRIERYRGRLSKYKKRLIESEQHIDDLKDEIEQMRQESEASREKILQECRITIEANNKALEERLNLKINNIQETVINKLSVFQQLIQSRFVNMKEQEEQLAALIASSKQLIDFNSFKAELLNDFNLLKEQLIEVSRQSK